MESTLINGKFTAKEAKKLLANLVKVKTDFHLSKIDAVDQTKEDIKRSENRIEELESELQRMLTIIQSGNYNHAVLHARLIVEVVPDYLQE